MNEIKVPDRIYVDASDKLIIEKLESDNIFNFKNKNRKDQFMFAFSIGVKHEMDLSKITKRQELFFIKDFKSEDIALLKASAINKTKDIEILENIAEIYRVAEEYAHSGFVILEGLLNSTSLDSIEKKFEVEINEAYNNINFL